jgi:fumarylacetoacetase
MSNAPSTPADPTLDPSLRSWVESANDPNSDFPIQNLPLGVFDPGDDDHDDDQPGHDHDDDHAAGGPRPGVAIGDCVLDIDLLMHNGWFTDDRLAGELHEAFHFTALNPLMDCSREALRYLRQELQRFLRADTHAGQQVRRLREKALHKQADVHLLMPWMPPNYTDFYASVHHATNVGSMFRPDNPLLPNYKHVPIGYHGRASSIVATGTPITRPSGQTLPDGAAAPTFGPSKRLDYELELGCIIGRGNDLGKPIPIAHAMDHVFGFVLVNDWSARDLQAWEYQPLGPFLAKNFATSVSPWIVSPDALAPFRCAGPARAADDPAPLPHLTPADPLGGFDLTLEVSIASAAMRAKALAPHRVSRGNFRDMFWTFAQMITHHASNGCNLMGGDLLASGTISGPTPDSRGCLLELSWAGNGPDKKPLPRKPIELPTGEKRTFLEDGDEVILRAWAERPGFRRIGFGECRGIISPAG